MSRKGIYQKLITLSSLMLTILFVYTAVGKLITLDTFQIRLARMPYIAPFAPLLSWGVPFLEMVIAGLLLIPNFRILGLYTGLVLLAVFTGYIITVLQFSDSIPCSCGGVLSLLSWKDHIFFNISFMFLALAGIIWSKKYNKPLVDQNTT